MNDKKRLAWFILARMTVVALFFASTLIYYQRRPESHEYLFIPGLFWLIGLTYLISLLSLIALRLPERFRPLLESGQIIWDILFVTILILLTGGIASPYSFLYMLSIISASVLMARRQTYYAASLCSILYGGMIDLHYYGKLSFPWLSSTHIQQTGSFSLLYTIFVNIVAFYLTAVLSGYLAERVRSSESALQEKVIDYEELERLNSAIVHNLYSGLLTVTPEGRIRAFNRHAEELTGLPLIAVYDRPLEDVIPGFAPLLQQPDGIASDEIQFVAPTGDILEFGYRAVPLADKNGERIGTIVHFKDLTVVKRMAEQLKRADRLAAIGGVAARMAHEIRNPLASISGSVQLIAQGDRIAESDRRLVNIVLRETDRLNGLIEEFLGYARPEKLQKGAVNLSELLGELDLLIKTDHRFQSVKFSNDCPASLCVLADHRQLQQVFWNLLLNAAEAMTDAGRVEVSCRPDDTAPLSAKGSGAVRIEVRDNGCGLDSQQLKNLFEPFYTTKPGGSGLGLATVYRIIEAHGGRITVESEPGRGTVFILQLPSA